jgi:hypothetical protein
MSYQITVPFLLANASTTGSYTASTTQAQGNGPIVYGYTYVGFVANDNDAITLPECKKDAVVILQNGDSSEQLELWPASGDAIGDLGTDASMIISPQQLIQLIGINTSQWYVMAKSRSVATSLTAFSGGGQGSATQMLDGWNRVSNVAAHDDSVKLPAAKVGSICAVYNDDAGQNLAVYPSAGHRINDLPADIPITLSPDTGVVLRCFSTALWHTWYGGNNARSSFTASVTQSQGNGVVMSGYTRINSIATDGNAITLPEAYNGNEVILFNDDTSNNYAQVFPASSDGIDSLGTNQPFLLYGGQFVLFHAVNSSDWHSQSIGNRRSVQTGIIANGNVIGTATQLLGDWNVVATSTASDNAVQLPVGYIGRKVWILNDDSADAVLVFPKSGASSQINDLAIDASITLAAKSSVELRAVTATKWKT